MSERFTIGAVGRTGEGIQFAGRVLAEAAASAGLSPLLVPEPGIQPKGDRSAFRVVIDTETPLAAEALDWLLICQPDTGGWQAPHTLADTHKSAGHSGWHVPATEIAYRTEYPQGAMLVLLGALSTRLDWLTEYAVQRALKELLPDHPRKVAHNMACFRAGRAAST